MLKGPNGGSVEGREVRECPLYIRCLVHARTSRQTEAAVGTVEIERKFLVASDETLGKPGPSSLDAAIKASRSFTHSSFR